MPLSKLERLKRDAEEVRFLERQGRYPEAHKMLWDTLLKAYPKLKEKRP